MRKIKRIYDNGGAFKRDPSLYGTVGQFAGDTLDTVTPTNQYGVKSNGAAIGSGALKGAGTGAAIGSVIPGIGTAVGAVVGGVAGGVSGLLSNNKNKKLQQAGELQNTLLNNQKASARLANYDTMGSNTNQIYAKYGGAVPIKYVQGGDLKELSDDNEQIEGASHAQGGVKLSPEVEVEGGETLNTSGNEPFVFSEKLGFAQLHKPIAKAIGLLEKKVSNNTTNNTIKLLKQKEEALKQQQEEFKKQLGLKGVSEYELGGKIKKHSPFEMPSTQYATIDNYLYKLPKRI
jgi:hypothetical protein